MEHYSSLPAPPLLVEALGIRGRNTEFWVDMGMGGGGAGGKEEETLEKKKLFLVGLFFFQFSYNGHRQFQTISHSLEIHKSGLAVSDTCYTGPGTSGKGGTLTLTLAAALPSALKGSPHFHPSPALGPICFHIAEEPGHKGPPHPTAQSLCLWLPPPG